MFFAMVGRDSKLQSYAFQLNTIVNAHYYGFLRLQVVTTKSF